MKPLLTLVAILLISISSFAQQGVNYKAVIKDDLGNVIANQPIDIQFTILLSGAGLDEIYKETHAPTTNANGLIILNIGEGSATFGNFTNLDWNLGGDYLLEIEIDLNDDGTFELTDQTYFKSVPFAKIADVAKNVSGLEKIVEDSGISGWRLVNANPENYGPIGDGAVDLSSSFSESDVRGATGDYSFAVGDTNIAAKTGSIAMGVTNRAKEDHSIALGANAIANGESSAAIGTLVSAYSYGEIALGVHNEYYDHLSSATWEASDRIFTVGNGEDSANRSNALTILKNGTIIAPSLDISEITDDKSLITKEYAETNLISSGLEQITENDGTEDRTGWRLSDRDPAYYGPIGNNAVDLSISVFESTDNGALGNYSIAMGNSASAEGSNSIAFGFNSSSTAGNSVAVGYNTIASGSSSIALGRYTIAQSFAETSIGIYNTMYTPSSTGGWNATDRLFTIGNGQSSGSPSNALTILKNGNIGLGDIESPEVQLHLDGDIRINDATLTGFGGNLIIGNVTNGLRMGFYDGIGWEPTDNNTVRLGSSPFRWTEVWSVNPLNTSSDRRLKKDISPIHYGLDAVMKLKPVSYRWKQGKQDTKLGFIAQDVESVVPEIVKLERTSAERKEQLKKEGREIPEIDYYAMSYTELIPVVVKALQEQQTIIENQNIKLEKLDRLEKELNELKALLIKN